MTNFDTRKWVRAAAASATSAALATFPRNRAASLSPAALQVAQEYAPPGYSPIVVAGIVRLIEFVLGVALLSMLAFQAADIYQIQAFRGHEKQYMRLVSAWSVVFLIATGISFFAKAGDQLSR